MKPRTGGGWSLDSECRKLIPQPLEKRGTSDAPGTALRSTVTRNGSIAAWIAQAVFAAMNDRDRAKRCVDRAAE
jgi:hypothetical protein